MQTQLLYTKPADIDGEPGVVRELSVQQLADAVAQVSELSVQTIAQVRAAGLERYDSERDWLASDEGAACRSLVDAIDGIITAVKRLQQAV